MSLHGLVNSLSFMAALVMAAFLSEALVTQSSKTFSGVVLSTVISFV